MRKVIGFCLAIILLAACVQGENLKASKELILDEQYPMQKVEIEGTKIAYVDVGPKDKEVLLFVHGYFVDHTCWNFTMKALENDYRLIALDLPGSGNSDKPEDASYSPDYYAVMLGKFIKKLGLTKVTLLGISMGGLISAKTTLLFPELVSRLVLSDSAGMVAFTPEMRKKMMARQTLENYLSRTEADYRRSLGIFFHKKNVPGFELIIRSVLRRKHSDYEAFLKAQIKSWDGMMTAEGYLASKLNQITVPTLVVWGKMDGPLNYALGMLMHKGIKGSQFKLLENCGHIPMLEQPWQFNEILTAFLEGK